MSEISIYQAQEGQELETIRKGNQLIEARYNLNAFQQLLLVELLPQINTYDEDFKDYRIDIAEFAKENEMAQNKEIYKRVQEALESLVIEPVKLISGDDVFSTAWLSSVKYRRGRGYADVSFHPDLKPLLLLMKSHYTEYPKDAIRRLRSKHAFRFYDWLVSYKYKGNGGRFYRTFTVAEIREKLALRKDEYKYFKDLRVYAIEPALKDINDNTDLRIIDIEYNKNGQRSYNEVKITVEPKKQRQLAIIEEPEPKTPEENKTESPIIAKLLTVGVSATTAKKWLDKFGESCIKQNLSYSLAMQKEGKIKTSFTGYLAKAVAENWGEGFEGIEQKTKEPKKKAETEERKKEREAEEKSRREREERERIYSIFDTQPEEIKDIILDTVEEKIRKNAVLLGMVRKNRKDGDIKQFQVKTSKEFKETMQENGLID